MQSKLANALPRTLNKFVGTCHLRLNLWLQKLAETLWSLWPVELPGVPMDNIYKQESDPRYTGIHFRKVKLAFCRFSCQTTERWQIHCSETHSPGRATSWQVYSTATDAHSPMRAGEWNFTPLILAQSWINFNYWFLRYRHFRVYPIFSNGPCGHLG